MRMTSVSARKVATEVHAQFIPPLATVPLTATRSRNSRKRVSGQREQASKDGSPPPHQRPGKEKASDSEAAAVEKGLGYQSPARELKGIYSHGDTDSGEDECRKKLYVMYGGSSELVSQRDVKTLRREVLSVKPGVPWAAPHHRWRNTTISFGPSDCPENMAGAGVLPSSHCPCHS